MTAIGSASSKETARLELANLEFIDRDGHKQNFSSVSSRNLPSIPPFLSQSRTPGVLQVGNSPWQEQPEEEEGGGDFIQHGYRGHGGTHTCISHSRCAFTWITASFRCRNFSNSKSLWNQPARVGMVPSSANSTTLLMWELPEQGVGSRSCFSSS